MLMLGFSISSCSKSEKEEIPIELNDLNSTVRSVSCGPEGNNCLSLGTQTSSFLLNGNCWVTVIMDITKCIDPVTGKDVYYFEDDGQDIIIGPGCGTMTDAQIQLAYDRFIEYFFISHPSSLISCSQGSSTTSMQIKMDCTRLCLTPSHSHEGDVYRYVSCAAEQGCCIQQVEWCKDSNGVPVSSNEVNIQSTAECVALTPNCDNDTSGGPFVQYDPCGVRCDL